jgi:hypothetical protein
MRNIGSMSSKWIAAILTSTAFVASSLAADPVVDTTVTPAPAVVTYSRLADSPPFVTYAAYQISITNNSTNALNNVRFEGVTSVVGSTTVTPFSAPFVSAIGITCTTPVAPTAISCSIGQLRGGGGSTSFIVIFQAPIGGAQIDLAWTNYYAEGSNDSGAHVDTNTGTAVTTLGTPVDTEVKTYVLPGGTFFTGLTGVATAADAWTTTVTVPAFAKAEVVESTLASTCSSDLLDCRTSALNIPGTFANLVITLRRDVSTIRKGAKIDNSQLYYAADGVNFDANPVPLCADVGGAPSLAFPRCVQSRTEFTKKTAPTPDWEGDWQWVVWAFSNGVMKN